MQLKMVLFEKKSFLRPKVRIIGNIRKRKEKERKFFIEIEYKHNKNNTNNIIELIQNQATRLLVTADWAKIENINYSMVVRIIRSLRIVHTSRCSPEQ